MSKYCPDIKCDFWDDYPEGISKGKFCPDCRENMTVINPKQNDENPPHHDTNCERSGVSEGQKEENEVSNLFFQTIGHHETKITMNLAKERHKTPSSNQEKIMPLRIQHPQIKSEMDENGDTFVRIHFNTLILRKYYEKMDAICLRIGHKYYQNFNISIVPFEEIGSVWIYGDEFVTIHGTLIFPRRIRFNDEIRFPYKYYFYLKSGKEQYEHLHHASNVNYNRYFIWDTVNLPISSLYNNTYQHFDMMVLPNTFKSMPIHGLVNTNQSNITSYAKTDPNIEFFKINERILVSFQAFLPSYYGCGYSNLNNLEEFLNEFHYIIRILCHAKLRDPDLNKSIPCDNSCSTARLFCLELVQSWIHFFYTPDINSSLGDATVINKFYLGCILMDNYNIGQNKLASKLIAMVIRSIESILKNKNDMLYDDNTPYFKMVQTSVKNFIFNTIKSSFYPKTILNLIPIFHMIYNLQDEENPLHERLEYTKNEYWGFPTGISVFSEVPLQYKELEIPLNLVEYDSLLSYTIVIHALNETNAQKLCSYFIQNPQYCPLSALMSALLFRLYTSKSSTHPFCDDNLRTITMRSIVNGFIKDARFNLDDVFRLHLLTITFALELKHFNNEQFKLCLTLISNTYGYCKKNNPQWSVESEKLEKLFKEFVINWYSFNMIKMDMSYEDYLSELDFWEDIISGYSFSLIWENIIEEFLKGRFDDYKITHRHLTTLIIDLQTKHPSRNLLKGVLINQLISKLHIISSGERTQLVNQLYQVFSEINQLEIVKEIINQVMIAENKHFKSSKLHHFVTWKSWDLYFTLLDMPDEDNILSEDVKTIVTDATHPPFSHLLDEINSFEISLLILDTIHKSGEYFANLVKIFQNLNCISNSHEDVNKNLDLCLDMFKWYLSQKKLFNDFLQLLGVMKNINDDCIQDFLSMQYYKKRLSEICCKESNKIRFSTNFLEENQFILTINKNYENFESICKTSILLESSIIIHIFGDFTDRIELLKDAFDFRIFYDKIWIPTLELCEEVLRSITDQTILLSTICIYFDGFTKLNSIENEIFQLQSAIQHYKNLPIPDKLNGDLKNIANRIHLYLSLERYYHAAKLILELKVIFQITTNFNIVKNIVDMKQTHSDKKLSELYAVHPNSISNIADKLTSLDLEVIQAIISNSTLITWIRENMVDLNEVKAFVDVSLTTCGDDPVEMDRILGFSSVCTNLAPVIFETNKDTSCNKLITKCSQVTNNVEKNADLIEFLGQVGKMVKYWGQLKQSHGAVEETTLVQFDNIIKNGTFDLKVGGSSKLNEMISLSIKRDEEVTKCYTLEELKEFRSRLMLIIRKKSDSYQNSQDFDHTLNNMEEIGKIVIQLSESGNQEYLTYFSEMAEQNLMGIKYNLNSILEKWRTSIEDARLAHYYLNYYTITQIVYLQKGIKSFLNGNKNPYQFYHLLRLLNHNVAKKDVLQALPQSQIGGSSLNKKERRIIDKVSKSDDLQFNVITDTVREMKRDKNYIISKKSIMFCYKRYVFEKSTVKTKESGSEPNFIQLKITSAKEGLFESYITFDELGNFLHEISKSNSDEVMEEVTLPDGMKNGNPNLVVIPSPSVFEFILSLYIIDHDILSLPLYHEILFCTDQTTVEEVDIFWMRAMMKHESKDQNIFCMVNIQNLNYQVAVQALSTYKKRLENCIVRTFKIVLTCSEGKETRSYLATAFEDFKRSVVPHDISEALKNQFFQKFSNPHKTITFKGRQSAWVVDKEMSRVRIVFSNSAGAGKSLYIQNLKSEMLKQGVVNKEESEQAIVTVAIHGKEVSEDYLTEQLLNKNNVKHGVIFHLDIASTIQIGIETILFKFLILGVVSKKLGELWHCRMNDYLVIEITLPSHQNTLMQFTNLFPKIECYQPSRALSSTDNINTQTVDLQTFRKEHFQRVNSYLMRFEIDQDLDKFVFRSIKSHQVDNLENLQRLLKHCEIIDPSWAELQNFAHFLNKQLSDCDKSHYCSSGLMGEEWRGFKSFVVKFMLFMSKNFATSSLCKYSEQETTDLTNFSILEDRRWEKNSHPYIFFNPDGHTMTFLGFHISEEGNLIDPDNPHIIIKSGIMHPELFQILGLNKVFFQQNFHQLNKLEKISKISSVINMKFVVDPDPGYVLTLDNTKKILAILMRFRCNIPVVIMGETGCGKTRLIQFMCSLQALQTGATNMLILKVHGGTTEKEVISEVEEAEKLAKQNFHNYNIDTVLFFDEANTSPVIGLIKEIMCDRRMYGRHISSDIRLQFIAACNPYRRHTKEMLHKLSTAGLGFFTKSTDTTDRLGDIPLRELVYRVIELPASMRPLVWDFGQLSNDIEKTYTREMVAKHLRDKNSPIEARDDVVDAISEVLAGAQNYMRERRDECSFVSLRDVERAMRVMLWFYSNIRHFRPKQVIVSMQRSISVPLFNDLNVNTDVPYDISEDYLTSDSNECLIPEENSSLGFSSHETSELQPYINDIDCLSYSLILSLAICYRARLQERVEFDKCMKNLFQYPLTEINDHNVIQNEVNRCQQIILDEMILGPNIAKNAALKENVFMMFVCIELKIPLFVIGKPGSSKSLAKSIISNSMQGNRCPDGSILQNFKQTQIMSYQCSQLSTADGIIGIFNTCRNMQHKTGSDVLTACVVLEEVGLAEDSPLLPLKVLQPLLEDPSYGFQDIQKTEKPINQIKPKIVDVLKVLQPLLEDPSYGFQDIQKTDKPINQIKPKIVDENENRVAFIGISNWSLDPAKMNRGIMVTRGDPDLNELIISAQEISKSTTTILLSDQIKQVHSSVYKIIPSLAKAYDILSSDKLEDKHIDGSRDYFGLRDFYSLIKMLMFTCSEMGKCINLPILQHVVMRNFGGITFTDPVTVFVDEVKLYGVEGPDSSSLGLVKANLANLSRSFHGETRYLLLISENYAALNILLCLPDMWPKQDDMSNIRVMFGSSFPNDQEYSTICRDINRIKLCMESGKTIILLDLENLYESLYDALNQHYMILNNQRYVDLGLGTQRMKCRIHDDFKLIVAADPDTVKKRFPLPLINRLEKHFISISNVLTEEGSQMSQQLAKWALDFSSLEHDKLKDSQKIKYELEDCFIGFDDHTPSSIVFHVINCMYPNGISTNEEFRTTVFSKCQNLLLKMATIESVLRVKHSKLHKESETIISEYFKQKLCNLQDYLRHILEFTLCTNEVGAHLTLATTHSRFLTEKEVDKFRETLSSGVKIRFISLHQFQTEYQYSRGIQMFLTEEPEMGSNKKILLVQCEGANNTKLIACARHKLVDELKEWREENKESRFKIFIVFLVLLNRQSRGSEFASYCGGYWNTVHIDDIRSLALESPSVSSLIEKKIYQIFEGENQVTF